jgi:hypothetical protein
MHVMFLTLVSNMTDSSKPNVQSMCEKSGTTPPSMPVIVQAGTVSFI